MMDARFGHDIAIGLDVYTRRQLATTAFNGRGVDPD
jgi:hypothetical protein